MMPRVRNDHSSIAPLAFSQPLGIRAARSLVLRSAALFALTLCVIVAIPLTASAQQMVSDAKAAEQIGEKLDGFLALIDSDAPAAIKKLVVDTNNMRRDRYTQVATMRGATLESVGRQAAVILHKRAAAGHMLQTKDGKWKKK